jgi:hypothetical protein
MAILKGILMLNYLGTWRSAPWRRPWPLPLESLENGPFLSTSREPVIKGRLFIATLVAIAMTAFDPCAYADLYVCTYNSNSVLRYDESTGTFIDAIIDSGSGGLRGANGLLLGPDGNLYVSSFNTNSVLRYDGTTGAPLPAPGKADAIFVTPGDGGLQGPVGLILGQDGNLYVSSRFNSRVLRYSGTTGDFLGVFVESGSGGLNSPWGLVFGPDGNLYVMTDGPLFRYDGTTGAPLPAPGQSGASFVTGWSQAGPTMVFGPDGNLYLSDFTDISVVRFNGATGEFMDIFVSNGSGGLNNPTGLVFGPDNNLYVSSFGSNSVLRYDGTTGAFIDAFIASGRGGLKTPLYLLFTHTDPTTLAYVPPPHSRFLITAPSTAVSGTPFDVTVTTLDPTGNTDTNYQGTVTFATTDTGQGVMLPGDYTFTTGDGGDNGVHTFTGAVTLVTMGDQTLTATDKSSGITGSVTVAVGP